MGKLEEAVQADLELYGEPLASTALAVTALDMARRLDEPGIRPAAASMLHAQLRATLLELVKLAPEPETQDGVTDLNAERDARRKAAGIG